MKKLIVLALVLSMATMASAALQISVNGVEGGTVVLMPSETAVLSISTDSIIGYGNGDWAGAALVCDVAQASITGGVVVPTTEPGLAVFADAAVDLGFMVPTYPAENGLGFMILFTGADMAAGTMLFDEMIVHCEAGAGPMTITLWGSQDYVEFTNLGSVTITQIPEPMTMGLLGLGGLFLRRRSK